MADHHYIVETRSSGTFFRCAVCNTIPLHFTPGGVADPPVTGCPGVPIYEWEQVPDGLFTKRQLSEKGLKLAKDAQPAGVIPYSKAKDGWVWFYRESDAGPKPELSEKQKAAAEANRRAWHCTRCGFPTGRYVKDGGLCDDCLHVEELIEQFREDRAEAARWSERMLRHGQFVIFDTETTGLWNAEIVQAAVIDWTGRVLLDTLIKPQRPERLLERGANGVCASDINRIRPEHLTEAPTFPDVYPELKRLLHGQRVVIYNRDFDLPVLSGDCWAHELDPIKPKRAYCAMLLYAQFCGEWSDYHGSYRWQKLPGGGHTALSDCQATLALLRSMAGHREEGAERESSQEGATDDPTAD